MAAQESDGDGGHPARGETLPSRGEVATLSADEAISDQKININNATVSDGAASYLHFASRHRRCSNIASPWEPANRSDKWARLEDNPKTK